MNSVFDLLRRMGPASPFNPDPFEDPFARAGGSVFDRLGLTPTSAPGTMPNAQPMQTAAPMPQPAATLAPPPPPPPAPAPQRYQPERDPFAPDAPIGAANFEPDPFSARPPAAAPKRDEARQSGGAVTSQQGGEKPGGFLANLGNRLTSPGFGSLSAVDWFSLSANLADAASDRWGTGPGSGEMIADALSGAFDGARQRRLEDEEADYIRGRRKREQSSDQREDEQIRQLDAWWAGLPEEERQRYGANTDAAYEAFLRRGERQDERADQVVSAGPGQVYYPFRGDGGELVTYDEEARDLSRRATEAEISQRYASGDRRRAVTPAQARQFRNDYEGEIRPLTDLRLRVEGTLPYARDVLAGDGRPVETDARMWRQQDSALVYAAARLINGPGVLSDADIRALSSPSLAGVFADVEGFLDENGRLSDNQRRALADVVARNADNIDRRIWSTYDNHAAFASEYDLSPEQAGISQPSFDRPGEEEAAGAIPTADQWRYDEGGQAIPYQDETTGRWYLPIRGRVQMVGPDHPAVLRFQRDDDERSNDRGPEIRGRGGARRPLW